MSSRQLHPVCVQCRSPLPNTTWLPFYGLLTAWRCRSCGAKQPRSRFFWEVIVAAYFLLLGWKWDDSRQLVFAAISAVPLLLIFIIDLRGNILYLNSIVLAFVVAALLGFLDGPAAMGSAMVGLIAGVAIGFAFFALSRWVFRSMHLEDLRYRNRGYLHCSGGWSYRARRRHRSRLCHCGRAGCHRQHPAPYLFEIVPVTRYRLRSISLSGRSPDTAPLTISSVIFRVRFQVKHDGGCNA